MRTGVLLTAAVLMILMVSVGAVATDPSLQPPNLPVQPPSPPDAPRAPNPDVPVSPPDPDSLPDPLDVTAGVVGYTPDPNSGPSPPPNPDPAPPTPPESAPEAPPAADSKSASNVEAASAAVAAAAVSAAQDGAASMLSMLTSATRAALGAVDLLVRGFLAGPSESRGAPGAGSGDGFYDAAAPGAISAPVAQAAGAVMLATGAAAAGLLLWFTALRRTATALAFAALPMLSRIGHDDLYENEARRRVHEVAVINPGLCLNEIVNRTGYSRNAVSYHLFVLEKEGELVSVKDGKYRRYFPRGGKYVNGAKNVVSVLRNEKTLAMAQHILAHPGSIQRELCEVLGTTASAACWHIKRLEEHHVIEKRRVANTVQYYPGEAVGRYDLSDFGLQAAAPAPAPALAMPALTVPRPTPSF